jgi:hypothetical protein
MEANYAHGEKGRKFKGLPKDRELARVEASLLHSGLSNLLVSCFVILAGIYSGFASITGYRNPELVTHILQDN